MDGRGALGARKRPRQERSRFTVAQIREAAAQVFAERGLAGATTNHIAERAGVSIGSVYQYFPNKQALLLALVEHHLEEVTAEILGMIEQAEAAGEELEVLLARVVRHILEIHTAAPRLHHVLVYEAPRPPTAVDKLHELEDRMARAIVRMLHQQHGVSRPHAGHAAYLAVHIIETLVHEYVVHPPQELPPEVFVEELVAMLSGYARGRCSAVG